MSIPSISSSINPNFRVRNHKKSPIVEYITDQDQADTNMRAFLNYMSKQIHLSSHRIQINTQEKLTQSSSEKIQQIHNFILNMNIKHRSYLKAKSIGIIQLANISFVQRQISQALQYCEEAIKIDFQANLPQFITRSLIMKIFLLEILSEQNFDAIVYYFQRQQPLKIPTSNDDQYYKKLLVDEIKCCYKLFKKIKWSVNRKQFQLQQRLWETQTINQLLVYQYQIIIKRLTNLKPNKNQYLYQKGIQLSQKVLGESHKLTNLLRNIESMKKMTRKMINPRKSDNQVGCKSKQKLKKSASAGISKNNTKKTKGDNKVKGRIVYNLSIGVDKKIKTHYEFYGNNRQQQDKNLPIHMKLSSRQQNPQRIISTNKKKIQERLKNKLERLQQNRNKKEYLGYISHGGKIFNQEQLIKKSLLLQKSSYQIQNIHQNISKSQLYPLQNHQKYKIQQLQPINNIKQSRFHPQSQIKNKQHINQEFCQLI